MNNDGNINWTGNWAERPLGMRDIFPNEARHRRQLEDKLLGFFESRSFEMVSCGAFEYLDTLLRGRAAEDAEGWVQVFDHGGRTMALRPDMTPSIARMAAPLVAGGRSSIRWCYAERTYHRATDSTRVTFAGDKGAESTQVGAELIGEQGVEADAAVLALLRDSLMALCVRDWQMVLSHSRFARSFLFTVGFSEDVVRALLKCLVTGDYVGFRSRTESRAPLDVLAAMSRINPYVPDSLGQAIEALGQHMSDELREIWGELVQLGQTLTELGIADELSFDLTLVRDLTYYTGIVYEVFAPGASAPIALGGRYDGLLRHFGADAPAIGFTFEVERLMTLTESPRLGGFD